MAALGRSVRHRDEAAFRAVFDPQASTTADLWWANLQAMRPTTLHWSATGAQEAPPDSVRTHFGPAARVGQVQVAWAVSGDRYPAQSLLWLTLVPAGGRLLVADGGRPPAGVPQPATPLWALEPVGLHTSEAATVIAGSGTSPGSWLPVLDRAVMAVAARVPDRLRPGWNHRLVAELPSSEQLAQAVLGAPGARSRVAATTWPESTDLTCAPLRVVIDPAAVHGLPTLGRDVLATHEAVHVATRSPLSRTPLWLVEGYADWVALDRWPAAARPAAAPLLARVRAGQPPGRLPTDADFAAGDASQLALRYAEAWSACRYIGQRWSSSALTEVYATAHTDPGSALPRVLHQSQVSFETGWRRWLEDLARR